MIISRAFWRATAERSLSTGAQAALLAWGGGTLPNVSLPWWTVPAAFGGGVVVAALKCMIADRVTGGDGPGFTDAERTTG